MSTAPFFSRFARFCLQLPALAALIFASATAGAATPAPPSPQRPPNFVFVVADDLGLTLGCYSDPFARTPNIDRLADHGIRFLHAFATTASCSPSRSVILSGRHSHANGQYGLQHSYHHFESFTNTPTLPGLLKKSGYHTARIGKLHVGPDSIYPFDTVLGRNSGGPRNPVSMAQACKPFLASATNAPFFLLFCPTDPHRSGNATPPSRVDPFGNSTAYDGVREEIYDADKVSVPCFLPDSEAARAELAQYYQSVSRVDQGVGRLMKVLEETGQLDNTWVFFLSDNGIAFPGAKTTLYDPGIRLPLILRPPSKSQFHTSAGSVVSSLISWTDLAPTVLDLAGAAIPQAVQGKSFRPQLQNPNAPGADAVFASHTFHEVTMYYPMRAIRTRTHKLICNLAHPLPFPFAQDLYSSATWQDFLKSGDTQFGCRTAAAYLQRPKWELYDLRKDPDELVNLADLPAAKPIFDGLKARLVQFQESTEDPWVVKHAHE